ncbi:hypothetical protein HHI36_014456 [Cryptolaemus montrouzieri]|uniref:Uncharacterized protein n=1 Tax=Cryptolaemus montrouzieri TaxID=559131 RepID=A0ABD2N2K7_9CUCU
MSSRKSDVFRNKLQKLLHQVGDIEEVKELIDDISSQDERIFENAEEIIILAEDDTVENMSLIDHRVEINMDKLSKNEKHHKKNNVHNSKRFKNILKPSDNAAGSIYKLNDSQAKLDKTNCMELSLKHFFKSFSISMENFPQFVVENTQDVIAGIISEMKVRALLDTEKHLNSKENGCGTIISNENLLSRASVDEFFEQIANTVVKFPPTLIAEIKMIVCSIMCETELLVMKEKERSKYSATFTFLPSGRTGD